MPLKMPSLTVRLWIVSTALACIAVGSYVYSLAQTNSFVSFQSPLHALQHFIPQAQDVFGKSNLHVLVVGLDYDYDTRDQEFSKQSRSDVIMALNLDFNRHRVSVLSIPRDMVATLPSGQKAKINQAQSEGGIAESQEVIANWLGISGFDRYIMLRINTSKDLINAVGGIKIKVENSDALKGQGPNGPLDYDDNWGHLHIHLKPGWQHLSGDQAVGYARFRHDWCSDPCRIMRQQQVLRALVNKINQDKLNTLSHLNQILSVVNRDVNTNFTPQEEFVAAWAFTDLTVKNIHTAQVPYVTSVMLPDYGDALIANEAAKKQLVAKFFPNDDLTTGIHVRIENGTDRPRLGAHVASQLRKKGFIVDDVSDAPSTDVAITEIHIDVSNPDASYLVRNALGRGAATATIVSSNTDDANTMSGVTIVLGRDILASTLGKHL